MGLSATLLFSGWVIMYSMLRLNYCYCCVFFSFSAVFIFYIHHCLFESYHMKCCITQKDIYRMTLFSPLGEKQRIAAN